MPKKTKIMANLSTVMLCICKNRTQDKKYGPYGRLHYHCKEGWRCGTCKDVKPIPKRTKKETVA